MDKIILVLLLFIVGCSSEQVLNNSKIDYKRAALLNVELGRNYLAQGYVERAKRKFVHALKLMPKLAEAHSGMGYFWEVVKEYKEAEIYYLKSIALGGGKGAFYNQYAVFLCERGRYKEADKNFILAVKDKIYDQTAEVYSNAGLCSLKQGNRDKAEQYFIKSLDHDPKRSDLLLELAKMSMDKKDFKLVEDYLNQFYKINNKPSPEYLLLSIKLAKILGKEDVAVSKALVLKNLFSDSDEYKIYQAEYERKG